MKVIVRKALLLLILFPLLNFAGYQYALAHPRYNPYIGQSILQMDRNADIGLTSYGRYLQKVLRGDLGEVKGTPIPELLAAPLKSSLILLLGALVVSALGGVLLGVSAISRRTLRTKPVFAFVSNVVLSMPGFFLGVAIIGIMLYAQLLGLIQKPPIPISGFGLDAHLILPLLVLASRPMMQVARVTANMMEHELQQDYVRVAQSKGLGRLQLFWAHAFPNILPAVALTLGQSSRLLISGLIIVETLFLWPGLGRLFMYDIGIRTDGRSAFDFFAHPELLAALAVVFGALLLLTDLLASLLAVRLDPQQRRPTQQIQAGN
jgi:peptide/nickel transport system permease protein